MAMIPSHNAWHLRTELDITRLQARKNGNQKDSAGHNKSGLGEIHDRNLRVGSKSKQAA